MQSKKAAFTCGLSLAAVAILVPLVSRVNHLQINSQTGAGARQLRADANLVPPLPPPKATLGATKILSADGNPIPPLPPPKDSLKGAQVLSADGSPIPPLPPPKQLAVGLNLYIADGNPIPPLPSPKSGHEWCSGTLV